MTKTLDRDTILNAQDLAVIPVPIPEWHGRVWVRTLSGAERDEFEAAVSRQASGGRVDIRGLKARLVAMVTCDDGGKPLFTLSDVKELNRKSCAALDRVFKAAQKLNHLTDDDVEDLVGNSEEGPSDASG